MPESLFDPNRLDIRELAIEAPDTRQELRFDAHDFISEAELDSLIKEFSGFGVSLNLQSLKDAKQLFPDLVVDFRLSDNDKVLIKERLLTYSMNRQWGRFLGLTASLSLVDPDYLSELEADVVTTKIAREIASSDTIDQTTRNGIISAAEFRQTFPFSSSNRSIDAQKRLAKSLHTFHQENNWREYVTCLAATRIFQPNIYDQVANRKADWPDIESYLRKRQAEQQRGEIGITNLLARLAEADIIMARSVEVTERGLVIERDQPATTNDPAPAMPEARRY